MEKKMEIDNREEMFKIINELEKYAELEGSEWGEMCMQICQLYVHSSLISDRLVKALAKEIKDNAKYVKDHCEIVETEETVVTKFKRLEWYE